MDSGDWRYGQADEPWTEAPAPTRGRNAAGDPGEAATPAPNLWADDTDGWGTTGSWLPAPRPGDSGMYPAPADAPAASEPAWQPTVSGGPWPESTAPGWGEPAPAWDAQPAAPAASSWRQSTAAPGWGAPVEPSPASPAEPNWGTTTDWNTPAPALPVAPPRYEPTGEQPVARAAAPTSGAGEGPYRRSGIDVWQRPDQVQRRRVAEDEEFSPRRRDPYGEEPAYGPVLGYTAGWYGIPAVFYVIWLVTLDSDRQAFVGRQFVASLPWLFAAVVLSLAVAGLLRWAIVGWRALTLSFAAAVIGAGVATIAHSLSL